MTTDKRQFTLRTQEETFEKIKAIAEREHRSIAMEIEHIIELYVSDYEKQHGDIRLPD